MPIQCDYGSPPRAWGQSFRADDPTGLVRFTPTGVGTIMRARDIYIHDSVHPHGRGDNNFFDVSSPVLGGSPPRAWGQ